MKVFPPARTLKKGLWHRRIPAQMRSMSLNRREGFKWQILTRRARALSHTADRTYILCVSDGCIFPLEFSRITSRITLSAFFVGNYRIFFSEPDSWLLSYTCLLFFVGLQNISIYRLKGAHLF